MAAEATRRSIPFAVAPPALCTDNAAMVAAAGYDLLARRGPDELALDVFSTLPLARRATG
jgi:tRNA A37 threonylcarbamoyltransferase TsaD